mgnify:CR=1 FL=1
MFVFHSFILYIRLFCYNYINNPKKRMGKWCFHFFFYNFANEKEKSCLTSKLMYNMEV